MKNHNFFKSIIFVTIFILLLYVDPCISKVKLGIDVFVSKHLGLVKNKKVGLIINPTSVNGGLNSTVDILIKNGVKVVALYGPEHGVRGNAQAGEYVPYYFDEKYKLPVFSLYGQSKEVPADMLINIDSYMRDFDTKSDDKILVKDMVKGIDVMLFDIQDVGTRVYTYIATMAYAMKTCADLKIDFIVLDRPNPISGVMEGPILEYPKYSSFVGLYPIPMRHGMTVGELAQLFNERFLDKKVSLTVIPVENWNRNMWYDQTALQWVLPSPNMPTVDTATVYPGQVLFEGTNISEGRGTTKPFELFGAPWIDGFELTKKLNALNLPGVKFREAWFTPTFSKYTNKLCGGSQIHIIDRNAYRPFETTLHIIETIRKLYPNKLTFDEQYFDRLVGNSWLRRSLEQSISIEKIKQMYSADLNKFKEMSKKYKIYY